MPTNQTRIKEKLGLLVNSFKSVLYEQDEAFLQNMKQHNLAGDDISRYQYWEWTQGVGLYGIWKMFSFTHDETYLKILTEYYDSQLKAGLPSKNVNTTAPLLALSYLYEYTRKEEYFAVLQEWADWVMQSLPRTEEGGFQHMTSDRMNDGELWDDTLFMAVLFLGNFGRITNNCNYIEEAKYQFFIHIKYLSDRETGLWYHGWTFSGRHHFSGALWGRGNCWVTMAIPEFIEMLGLVGSERRFLQQALCAQAKSLARLQDESGMWRTLIDDESSYVEASATCGFGYGLIKAARMGLIDGAYEQCAMKALRPILDLIGDDGIVQKVSYGTAMGREGKEFYKQIPIRPMPYGQAIAMLFLFEVLNTADKTFLEGAL